MAFTTITVTSDVDNPDLSDASGTVCATLSGPMLNSGVQIDAQPICGVIQNGELLTQGLQPFELAANDDTATTPEGTHYTFGITVDGAPYGEFDAVVSHTASGGTVTLAQLEAAAL